MSFKKLSKKELLRTAEHDFAVEVKPTDTKDVIVAALAESGISFEDYLDANEDQREKFASEPEPVSTAAPEVTPNVITTKDMEPVREKIKVVVKEEVPLYTRQEWLIKMIRANPLYEVRGHSFTQSHPYALVSPETAEYLLTREEGFRQASPNELSEFYG